MNITYNANGLICGGKTYINEKGIFVVRQDKGDYGILRNVDFGKGRRGLEIGHYTAFAGVEVVQVHLDSLDGKCIGVIACSNMEFGNLATSWGEIEETSGIHDVYFTFSMPGKYRSFKFTTESPYDNNDYTPIDDKNLIDVQADTWEATDMLGRKVVSPEDCPNKRDKKVGMFYWTWHEMSSGDMDADATIDILSKYPEAEYDQNHHGWGIFMTHWNKPLFGYYRNTDPYVIRKHMIMLANAGVDFIAFDVTNRTNIMKEAYMSLLEGMRLAKADGINVPKITFLMPFGDSWRALYMLRAMYQDLYKPGLYSDLWFEFNGKPLVMAYPGSVPEEGHGRFDTELLNEIREFYTFRPVQPSYAFGPKRPDHWGWLESAPQHKYGEREDGSCEMMTVGVAQNRTDELTNSRFNIPGSYGRSYTDKDKHSKVTADSYKYGYNFQEQWDNALEADPDLVFITGWNEWIAGRWRGNWIEEGSTQVAFVDQYDREHSRDIEPDCDGYLDTYYLQLCDNIRKYKGTSKLPQASEKQTIDISKGKDQWENILPVYKNHKGSAPRRDYPGFGKTTRYVNRTGRNDITESRVARDDKFIYFSATCVCDIKETEKENCMALYLNTDRDYYTGWEGYNYRIVKNEIQRFIDTSRNGGFTWEKVADVEKTIDGNFIQIKLEKSLIGLGEELDIEFKWSDNNFPEGRVKSPCVMDFYENGVSAPFGRFNYRYKTK